MYGGSGGEEPPPGLPVASGGEFLLSLLQRPNSQQRQEQQPQQYQLQTPPFNQLQRDQLRQPPQQLQSLSGDPAVAAVGPGVSYSHLHQAASLQNNGRDLASSSPWPHTLTATVPSGFFGLPHDQFKGSKIPSHNQQPRQQQQQQPVPGDDIVRSEFYDNRNITQNLVQHKQVLEQKLQFGSFPGDVIIKSDLFPKERESGNLNGLERNLRQFDPQPNSNLRTSDGRRKPPPGFLNKTVGGGNGYYVPKRRDLEQYVNREKGNFDEIYGTGVSFSRGNERERLRGSNGTHGLGLTGQLDRPGPPAGSSNLHSVSASDVEESMVKSSVTDDVENGEEDTQELDDNLEADEKKNKKNKKEFRSDNRGNNTLSQRERQYKSEILCRRDINRSNSSFLGIYQSLLPPEEEKAKQKQLLALLEKLVKAEWPGALLYLYGSCANSFGVMKSDIDVCLAMVDTNIDKSVVLLKLADILQADNLQNVQALTRARVPIVKLKDPVTDISCDICINNVLAVVNTKLLRDYAQIDVRLRQLAIIVKHWAKSRVVNETYQGTLSSYAYVLMCIHFLQLRRPAILPCLQKMKPTYSITVDDLHCSYFDRVDTLEGFGSHNKETISELVWGFFTYWAYRHNYSNDVISVRTGSLISKWEKDWTRRIGNDRHLICIEDPFETSHDLGRVVDKYSIKVLREEFERAARIMQNDPNPSVTLFEPYVPS